MVNVFSIVVASLAAKLCSHLCHPNLLRQKKHGKETLRQSVVEPPVFNIVNS